MKKEIRALCNASVTLATLQGLVRLYVEWQDEEMSALRYHQFEPDAVKSFVSRQDMADSLMTAIVETTEKAFQEVEAGFQKEGE